jgi:hypothetical protein
MDSIGRIEDLIVTNSDGFFDEPGIRADLHVTIRIAGDFYDFLVKFGENPPAEAIDFVIGTIRSGIDEFFSLAYICRLVDTARDTWTFDRHSQWDFPALRERFLRSLEHLAESRDASAAHSLASLFALVHLELVFLAQHFPLAIFEM